MGDVVEAGRAKEGRELGTLPIGKLFVKYSLISLSGMVAQIVMVILEGIIMGYGLGSHGLACVSIIISVELLNLATGGALGIGISALVGTRFGAGDDNGAQRAFGQGFWLTVYVAAGMTVAIELLSPHLVHLLGATDDIYADALLGVRCFVAFFPFTIVGQVTNAVLRVDEKPQVAANLQILSSVVAIVILALTVLVLGWGVTGAGIYFGFTIGLWALGVRHFLPGGTSVLRIRREDMRLGAKVVGGVLKIGLPYFVLQVASSAYTMVVNNRLGVLGSSMDIAAFAIVNGYIVYVLMLVVMAFGFAMQAISSFNIGARRYDRLSELLVKGALIQTAFMVVASALVCLFPEAACQLFALDDPVLAEASATPVRIVVSLCALGYLGQLLSSYFECIGAIVKSVVCGCALYLMFTIPLIYVLGPVMGVEGVWFAQPVANLLTGVLVLVLMLCELRRFRELRGLG